MRVAVTVIEDRRDWRRFHDLAQHLHRGAPGWSPPAISLDRARLEPVQYPGFFGSGRATGFLARDRGRPAGRITAQIAGPSSAQGWFGFFESTDDDVVARALVDAAAGWLADQGCSEMRGPFSLAPDDEWGLRVHGHGHGPITTLPWHPPHYATLLRTAGLVGVERRSWRVVNCVGPGGKVGGAPMPSSYHGNDLPGPEWLGGYRAAAVVVDGVGGSVIAIPDVVGGLSEIGLRGAWSAARRARRGEWARCVVISSHDPEATRRLVAMAGQHGFAEAAVPVSDPNVTPDIQMEVFARSL